MSRVYKLENGQNMSLMDESSVYIFLFLKMCLTRRCSILQTLAFRLRNRFLSSNMPFQYNSYNVCHVLLHLMFRAVNRSKMIGIKVLKLKSHLA